MENGKGREVSVQSVLTVVSSTPVKPGSTCPLSPLDHAMGQHSVHVIFYYRFGSLEFYPIRSALNEVLTLYPNVTGRLAKDGDGNWEVKCTDAGVRVYLAKVGTSVDEWLRSATSSDERDLTAWDDLPDDPHIWSPYRIQITDFEGGGTAIGLSCLHMLADPTSATLLIKSWTEVYRHVTITHPPLFHPLALSNPSTTTTTNSANSVADCAAKSATSAPHQPLKMASATFCFSDSTIKRSLSENRSSLADMSPFDLLTALFWTRISGLKTTFHDHKSSILICKDMRKHLNAQLPHGYFGNALHFSRLTVDPHELDSKDLGQVAQLVHRHVSEQNDQEFWSAVKWFESRKDDQGKFAPPFKMYGPELTVVDMEYTIRNGSQPLIYMAMFEKDQMPAHVSYQVGNWEGEGLVLVMPSPEEGLARRVTVTLPEEEMEKLLEDEVILSLQPTLLLSGRS